jgi:hypothetical protein
MAQERPYSLLIRLGILLLPILTAVLIWSYHHPPASMLAQKPAGVIVIPAPAKGGAPFGPLPEAANPVSGPAPIGTAPPPVPAPASVSTRMSAPAPAQQPARPDGANIRAPAMGSRTPPGSPAIPPSAMSLSPAAPAPAIAPFASQSEASGREQAKARDPRKRQPAGSGGAVQKLDKEIDGKLSICRGC